MRFLIACFFLAAAMVSSASADPVQDTDWCFSSNADSDMVAQIGRGGKCSLVATAAAVAGYLSGASSEVLLGVATQKQNEFVKPAPGYACSGDAVKVQIAVRLIQICNCHNTTAWDDIENNQDAVKATLRTRGGC